MKVLLAIPTGGSPTAPFLASLNALVLPDSMTAFDRITVVGNFVPGQRELAARRAVRLGADVLVMADDDMVLPPEVLGELMGALSSDPQLAVVGALYYARDGLRPIVADHWDSRDTTTARIPAYTNTLTYCDVVGFGCAALRVSALCSMPPPYFRTQVYVEERAARVRICNEDFLFCEDVRRAGWSVALHSGLRCKHHDRSSGIDHPREWEDPAATSVERMIVADPGPSYRLVPYDAGQPTAAERHEIASMDYIIVD